jgi:hypothetical protein
MKRNPAAWQVMGGHWRLARGICLVEGYQIEQMMMYESKMW